jgi:hypothetical protein
MGSQNKWINVFAQEALSIYLYREGKVFARLVYCFTYIDNVIVYLISFCTDYQKVGAGLTRPMPIRRAF